MANPTATTIKQATPGASPPPASRPLEAGRVRREGELNPLPLWVNLRSADELDDFFKRPGFYLQNNGAALMPFGLLRVIDDASTVYTEAIVLVVRGQGAFADVVEIAGRRTQLRPNFGEDPAAAGWSIAHRGSFSGWCLLKDGHVRFANLASEAAARTRLNLELANQAQRR